MKIRRQNNSLLCTLIFYFLTGFIFAQENKPCVAGIYKTQNDLEKNKVSHKIKTDEKDHNFGFLFPADLRLTIQIKTPDSIYEFKPGTVYGYTKCGKKFRYYPGGDLLAQEDFYGIEEI